MAKKSLAAAVAEPVETKETTALALPGGLGGSVAGIVPAENPLNLDWVQFYDYRAKNSAKIKAKVPGVQDADPILIQTNGDITKLAPFRFHLLKAFQYWARNDGQGKPLEVRTEDPKNKDFVETIESVILVHAPGGVVVATNRAARALTAGMHTVIQELDVCQTPEWLGRSAAHRETSSIGIPAFRFVAELTSFKKTGNSGSVYRLSEATCTPNVNLSEVRAAAEFVQSAEGQAILQKFVDAHENRKREVLSKKA